MSGNFIVDASRYLSGPPLRRNANGEMERPPMSVRLQNGMSRVIKMVTSAGNVVEATLTNAASLPDPTAEGVSAYARVQRKKWRVNGWFPWAVCPLALSVSVDEMTGQPGIGREFLVADHVGQTPCDPSTHRGQACKHGLAEIAARQDRNAKKNAERERMHAQEGEKALAEQKAIVTRTESAVASMAESVRDLTSAVASVVKPAEQPKEHKR